MRYPLSIFFIFSLLSQLTAQDLIIKVTDEEIIAKVLEIRKNNIWYKNYEDLQGERLSLPKTEILMIIFEDGMKQYFQLDEYQKYMEVTENEDPSFYIDPSLPMYERGIADAKLHYHKNGPMWGTFGATAFYPGGGIFTGAITGIIIAAFPPDIDLSQVPDPELFRSNSEYVEGFQRQARKMKIVNIAKGFGIGLGVQVIWILLISSL